MATPQDLERIGLLALQFLDQNMTVEQVTDIAALLRSIPEGVEAGPYLDALRIPVLPPAAPKVAATAFEARLDARLEEACKEGWQALLYLTGADDTIYALPYTEAVRWILARRPGKTLEDHKTVLDWAFRMHWSST